MRLKIIWGICGIGHGHIYRQLPLIEYYAATADILIFAYGTSYEFFKHYCQDKIHIDVINVSVPFYAGDKEGLNFEKSASLNTDLDVLNTNLKALAYAQKKIGKADLVISDYEPTCAQYAYAFDLPLITYDQQSKFLTGAFDDDINGFSCRDEKQRLRMFFPHAEKRIASSFFNVAKIKNKMDVIIVPSIIRSTIKDAQPITQRHIVVYFTQQLKKTLSVQEMLRFFGEYSDYHFHVFGSDEKPNNYNNMTLHARSEAEFISLLTSCSGVISTAGHGLLSEAMFLGKPVYAMPLDLYEQQLNAHIIDKNGFGIAHRDLTQEKLNRFMKDLKNFRYHINNDPDVLFKKDGLEDILMHIK